LLVGFWPVVLPIVLALFLKGPAHESVVVEDPFPRIEALVPLGFLACGFLFLEAVA
jgi:hypothetical protein